MSGGYAYIEPHHILPKAVPEDPYSFYTGLIRKLFCHGSLHCWAAYS